MKSMKKLAGAVLTLLVACCFAACDGDDEVMLSLTREEEDATMRGNWKVERAGEYNTDIAGEEHVTNLVESCLDYVTIDETQITFHFNPPAEVEYVDGADEWRETVTEYTFRHQNYKSTEGTIFFCDERFEDDPFMRVYVEDRTDERWMDNFEFTLYGQEKNESFATNLMLEISDGLTYWLGRMDD